LGRASLEIEDVGIDDELRAAGNTAGREQVDVVHELRLGASQHAQVVVDHLGIRRVLDTRDVAIT
jgi:hypothetical protein